MKTMTQCSRRFAPRTPESRRAFTLLELLVAATITALLAGFLAVVVGDVAGFWTRTSGRLTAASQARIVLDQIELDLTSALYRDDGNVWLAADILNANAGGVTGLWQTAVANAKPVGGLSLAMGSEGIADARFGNAGVWLRFITMKRGPNNAASAVTSANTGSAPAAIGYQIIRRFSTSTISNTRTAYLLHRSEVRATSINGRPGVLESGYNLDPNVPTNYSRSNFGGLANTGAITGDPRSIQIPGSAAGANGRNLDSVLADNVIDFGVRCYVKDSSRPSGLSIIFPALAVVGAGETFTLRPGYTTIGAQPTRLRSSLPATARLTAENYDAHFPAVVDVMVRVLTDEGARLIGAYEQANSQLTPPAGLNAQQYWWQIALANSHVFTRRIVLRAEPL